MIQIRCKIDRNLTNRLEIHISESEESIWVLAEERDTNAHSTSGVIYLCAYFSTKDEALKKWRNLRIAFPELPNRPELCHIQEKDWKEVYKQHYKPYNRGGLHWVPEWYRGTYVVPNGEDVLYLDPGMAFGMCDHPSTRLCLFSLIQFRDHWKSEVGNKTIIDAGCGSGILALSAAKFGFQMVYAFDNDPIAITRSIENCNKNGLNGRINIQLTELGSALVNVRADLIMANILFNVLYRHAESLLQALNPAGMLILSGMFKKEVQALRERYILIMQQIGVGMSMEVNAINDWYSLVVKKY